MNDKSPVKKSNTGLKPSSSRASASNSSSLPGSAFPSSSFWPLDHIERARAAINSVAVNERALMPSRQVTRSSSRNAGCSWPWPTSTPSTSAAPCCSRQSVKPPVDWPTSRQCKPVTSMPVLCNAASSFSPPREMYLASVLSSTCSLALTGISSPFLETFFQATPSSTRHCTVPAIRRWACERVVAKPCSTRKRSARMGMGVRVLSFQSKGAGTPGTRRIGKSNSFKPVAFP